MRLIPVCSGNGGTGKSCVSAYMSVAFAAMNKKVLLVDAGNSPGSLDVILGVSDTVVFNIWDVLSGHCDVKKAIIETKQSGLYLLPAGLTSVNVVMRHSFADLIRQVKYDYDIVIIDSPNFAQFDVRLAHMVVLVLTPDTLSVRAATQKNRELIGSGAKDVRLIVNNVPARILPMRGFKDFDDIIDLVGAQLLGIIPASQRLHYASNNGVEISAGSLTVQIFHRIAERVRGKSMPLLIK